MEKVNRLILVLVVACFASCNNFQVFRFETFDVAMAMASVGGDDPPMYRDNAPPQDLPSFVVYAQVNGDFHGGDEVSHMASLQSEIKKRNLSPDFIMFASRGAANVGTVTQHVGFGVYSSSPVYRPQASAWCCRIAPSYTGMSFDKNCMVVGVEEWARPCGIQEGDTLISIAGAGVKSPSEERVPEWSVKRLALKPGTDVKVIWIRPGSGRMEGMLTLGDPKPMTSAPSIVPKASPRESQYYN
jgi:hypothetical protein